MAGFKSKSDFNSELEAALDKQRGMFMDELENRFSSLSKAKSSSASQSSAFKFKSDGNKAQFDFNLERIEGLHKIDTVGKVSSELVSKVVKSEIEEVNIRNKLIKIADKHGWDTVREYSDSPLADDAEDAAKLRGAIARTLRNRRFKPYDSKPSKANVPQLGGVQRDFRTFPARDDRQMLKRFGVGSQAIGGRRENGASYGACFACHLYGHFAKECPYVQRNTVASQDPIAGSNRDSVVKGTERN